VSYQYDAAGRMTKLTDGENNETGFEYDSLGRLVKKTYADGSFY
jgi:YD repeat-containing protein